MLYRGYIALFNCLRTHNPEYKTKFTSSLYRHVVWQCRKAVREYNNTKDIYPLPSHLYSKFNIDIEIEDCLEKLNHEQSSIIRNYYFDKMTFTEIGKANNYSATTALKKLRQAEGLFRQLSGVY